MSGSSCRTDDSLARRPPLEAHVSCAGDGSDRNERTLVEVRSDNDAIDAGVGMTEECRACFARGSVDVEKVETLIEGLALERDTFFGKETNVDPERLWTQEM